MSKVTPKSPRLGASQASGLRPPTNRSRTRKSQERPEEPIPSPDETEQPPPQCPFELLAAEVWSLSDPVAQRARVGSLLGLPDSPCVSRASIELDAAFYVLMFAREGAFVPAQTALLYYVDTQLRNILAALPDTPLVALYQLFTDMLFAACETAHKQPAAAAATSAAAAAAAAAASPAVAVASASAPSSSPSSPHAAAVAALCTRLGDPRFAAVVARAPPFTPAQARAVTDSFSRGFFRHFALYRAVLAPAFARLSTAHVAPLRLCAPQPPPADATAALLSITLPPGASTGAFGLGLGLSPAPASPPAPSAAAHAGAAAAPASVSVTAPVPSPAHAAGAGTAPGFGPGAAGASLSVPGGGSGSGSSGSASRPASSSGPSVGPGAGQHGSHSPAPPAAPAAPAGPAPTEVSIPVGSAALSNTLEVPLRPAAADELDDLARLRFAFEAAWDVNAAAAARALGGSTSALAPHLRPRGARLTSEPSALLSPVELYKVTATDPTPAAVAAATAAAAVAAAGCEEPVGAPAPAAAVAAAAPAAADPGMFTVVSSHVESAGAGAAAALAGRAQGLQKQLDAAATRVARLQAAVAAAAPPPPRGRGRNDAGADGKRPNSSGYA